VVSAADMTIAGRLRWLLDVYEEHSDTAEYERSTCAADHASFDLEQAAAARVVADAIDLLTRAGLSDVIVERPAELEA